MRTYGRWIALATLACLIGISMSGIPKLKVDPDVSGGLLPVHGDNAEAYRHYLEMFPADYGTMVIATGDVCTVESWQQLVLLADELESLAVVDEVVGLMNAKYVSGLADTVTVKKFPEIVDESSANFCDIAFAYQPYQDLAITRGHSGQKAVMLYARALQEVDAVKFDQAVSTVLDHHSQFFAAIGVELFQMGELHISAELSRQTQQSTMLLPVTMAIMFAVAWFLTRSFLTGLLAAATGGLGVFFTFSLMGYTGVTQNTANGLMVNMLVPLGAAFAIHASSYAKRPGRLFFGFLPRKAVVPFCFAAATTAVGFGMTAISSAPSIVEFGVFGTAGIAALLLTVLFFCFPILTWGKAVSGRESWLRPLRATMIGPRAALGLGAVLVVFCVFGLARTRTNYAPIDYLLPSNPMHQNFDKAGQYIPQYTAALVVDSGQPDGALDPILWQKLRVVIEEQQKRFSEVRAAWFYDQLSELAQAFTVDQKLPLLFPDSAELIAQFLLLFEPQDTEAYIDFDRQIITIFLFLSIRGSVEYLDFEQELLAEVKKQGLDINDVTITGRVPQYFRIGHLIPKENLESVAIGIVLIFCCFFGLLRSARLAAVACFVNILPVLGALAFMGVLGIELDLGTSIVAAVALGLVVDDTGHFVANYNAHRKKGLLAARAAGQTLAELWQPIIYTTTVVVVGFLVMNFATMVPFHTFSRLLSVTMFYALFCDLVLLPVLLVVFDRRVMAVSDAKAPAGAKLAH